MSDSKYTRAVERELARVGRLVEDRRNEARLQEISSSVAAWKKKKLCTPRALEDIRRVVQAVPPPWSEEADPGVPVAQGIAEGLLTRKDLSDAAWKAGEVLVAVVEV